VEGLSLIFTFPQVNEKINFHRFGILFGLFACFFTEKRAKILDSGDKTFSPWSFFAVLLFQGRSEKFANSTSRKSARE
jgi:hypothetical protein